MIAPPSSIQGLVPNTNLRSLPLLDRTDWKRVKFGDVVENLNETCDPVAERVERYIGLEHLEPGSLHVRSWGNVADGTTFTRRCRKGQVLFGKRRAYQRKVAVAEFDAVVSGDIYVLAAKAKILLPELLPFICLSERFFQHAVGTSAGSLSPRTNWSSLASFEFDLPPLDQLRRIAEILWAVDEEVCANAALADSLQQTRLAKLNSIMPSSNESSGAAQFIRLDAVASMQNGRPFPSSEYKEPTADGVRLIRPGNLAPAGLLSWSNKSTVTLPHRFKSENNDWFVGPNQVLINLTAQSLEDGFMGRVCFTGDETAGLLNQRIGRFVLDGSILPKFFFRCLQTTRFRRLVESRCEGSKVRHIYFRHFEDFMLPKLSKEEQRTICEEIDACEAGLAAALNKQDAASKLRDAFTRSVFSQNL